MGAWANTNTKPFQITKYMFTTTKVCDDLQNLQTNFVKKFGP